MRQVPPATWLLTLGLITACSSESSEVTLDDVRVSVSVGPEGREIEAKGGMRLSIPEGALEEPVEINVRTVKEGEVPPLPPEAELRSRIYELTPHGQRFEREVELELPYEEVEDDRVLRVARLEDEDDEDWERVSRASFDDEAETAVVRLDRFSFYAVVACPRAGSCGLQPGQGSTRPDAGARVDAGASPDDAGRAPSDAGNPEPGQPDGSTDGGDGRPTTGMGDPDAGQAPDAGMQEAGMQEAGMPDGGMDEAGVDEAGTPDAETPDAEAGVGLDPASLTAQPTEADFGLVPVANGSSGRLTVTFRNDGDLPTESCNLTLDDPRFQAVDDTCSRAVVPGGGSCTVDIVAAVEEPGAAAGNAVLSCGNLSARSALAVEGTVPALVMPLAGHDFGPVPGGTRSTTISFGIRNDGLAPATGCSAPVLTGRDPGAFTILSDGCGSADLAPGTACTVSVAMAPDLDDTAERRATLERRCEVGGSVSTDANGLLGNRPHFLFVTSVAYNGDMRLTADGDGLQDADSRCQALADNSNGRLPEASGRTWRALLSTSSVDARDRVAWRGPVFDIRNIFAVADPRVWPWTLNNTNPNTPPLFVVDENGASALETDASGAARPNVWTGSSGAGLATQNTCSDWSVFVESQGEVGLTQTFPESTWLGGDTSSCRQSRRLICVSEAR